MIGNGRSSPLLTKYGGIAIRLINKTGAPSIEGTIVQADPANDMSVVTEDISGNDPFGIIFQSGIPDGEPVLVVISGIARVLIENGSAVISGEWGGTSDAAAGRAQSRTEPPATVLHDQEIGHFIESKSAGTDVLAKAVLHFR